MESRASQPARSRARPPLAALGLTALVALFALWFRARRSGVEVDVWPAVERLELDLDLSHPPLLQAGARLELAGVRGTEVPLLLNRALEVYGAALADGTRVGWRERPLASRYHREGRVLFFRLPEAPRDGRCALHLSYGGRGLDGSEGRDWRGALLLAPDELRMSEQTIFYPEVPLAADGPGAAPSVARVTVLAPAAFELFVPGTSCGEPTREGDARRWCFELARPGTLAVLGGPLRRAEIAGQGARVVTLLSEAHADLAQPFASRARAVLERYAAWWGPIEGEALGVVEILGRGSSYNWAQRGVVTFDRFALGDEVPEAKLAHELAHLWWGQRVSSRGAGERFLTESLAEYASWRFVEAANGAEAARELALQARREWLDAVHASGEDVALAEVGFDTEGYTALAYAKGPLALRTLEARMGREALDRALADFAERGAREGGTLALFEDCVERAGGLAPRSLHAPGHAHLALAGLEYDAASQAARLRIEARDCPSGCARLAPRSVLLDARGHGASARVRAELDALPDPIEIELAVEPAWIALDPDAQALVADSEPFAKDCTRLVASEPADGAPELPLGPFELRLAFDRPLAPLPSGALEEIRRASQAAARDEALLAARADEPVLEADGRALRIAIRDTEPGRAHVLALPRRFEDADGVPIAPTRVHFTVRSAEGLEPPRVVSSEPASGAREVALDLAAIRVRFSAPMRGSSGFKGYDVRAQARRGRAWPPIGSARWIDERTVEWPLEQALAPDTTYALDFGSLFRDELGVGLADYELLFTTEPAQR